MSKRSKLSATADQNMVDVRMAEQRTRWCHRARTAIAGNTRELEAEVVGKDEQDVGI